MDFTSNDFVLVVAAVIVVVLIRTLILASKEINSSDSPFQDLGYFLGNMYLPPEVDNKRKGLL